MTLGRNDAGGDALMILSIDQQASEEVIKILNETSGFNKIISTKLTIWLTTFVFYKPTKIPQIEINIQSEVIFVYNRIFRILVISSTTWSAPFATNSEWAALPFKPVKVPMNVAPIFFALNKSAKESPTM